MRNDADGFDEIGVVGIALFAFVCILVQLVWKPDTRFDAHRRAVDHYVNAKYDVQRLLDAPTKLDVTAVRLVEERYLEVRNLPPIRDAHFPRLKQRHLRKVDLSKRLDKNPWIHLPFLPGGRPRG